MNRFPELASDPDDVVVGRCRGVPPVVAMHRVAAVSRGRDGLRRITSARRPVGLARAGVASGTPLVRDRVLVAADPSQELVGCGVLRVLEAPSHPWEAHGVATTADDVVRRIVALRPDVLVATTQVGEAFPPYLVEAAGHRVRVILLAEDLTGRYEVTLLRLGAHGVVSLSVSPAGLVEATRTVLGGQLWVSQEAGPLMGAHPRTHRLTPERRAVLALLARDLSIGQVARELGISESGVKSHISRIGKATGITGVHALRANAERLLIQDEDGDVDVEPVVELKPTAWSQGVGREGSPR
jgi:DNA-binding NarL/FixJ family response regulator